MGKAKSRCCLECPEKPSIKGGSWNSHCKHNHNNRKDVLYKVNKSAKASLDIPICTDSKHFVHSQLSQHAQLSHHVQLSQNPLLSGAEFDDRCDTGCGVNAKDSTKATEVNCFESTQSITTF